MPNPGLEKIMNDPKHLLHNRLREVKAKKLVLLREKAKYIRENRLEFFSGKGLMEPNPLQAKLLGAWKKPEKKVFLITGGNRIGKTTINTIITFSVLFGKFLWNNEEIPFPHSLPRKVRYIGQDWEKHIQQVVVPTLHKWWPLNRGLTTKKNNVGAETYWVDEQTGGTLEVMSNKQEPELHEGWEGDLVVYDEPPRRSIRVANARGLVDRCGRELFGATLLNEAWISREVINARNPDGTPDTSVFHVNGVIWDNLNYGLTEEGIKQFAKTLDENGKQARLFGIPSYMSQLVYPQFNRDLHIKKRPKALPLDWILDIAIDFHPSKPWAVLFIATDSRGFKYIVDEIHENGSWKAIGEQIIRCVKRMELRVNQIIIDPLSKGDPQSDLNEESVFEKMQGLFRAYGYSLHVASKDKDGGIHIVQNLLMSENEMPVLFFMNNLKRVIYEIEGYMTDENGKPLKEDDDMMENLYRLALLDTQYVAPEDEDDRGMEVKGVANAWTGY